MVDTNILDITLLATNQTDRTTTVNDALQAIETATQALLAVDLTAGNVSLTEAQFTRNFYFECDGHLGNARDLTVPLTINAVASNRFYMVDNLDTGAVTVQGSTGATVVVGGGTRALIYNNGTDQIVITTSVAGATILDELTDVTITSVADMEQLVYDATYSLWVNEPIPFIISVFVPQNTANNELILSYVFERSVDFPSGMAGSQGYANTQPAGADTWNITKNGSNVGTVNFTGSSNAVTFTMGSAQSFVAGDRLELVGDASADASLAGVTLSFRGTRKS